MKPRRMDKVRSEYALKYMTRIIDVLLQAMFILLNPCQFTLKEQKKKLKES